MAMQKPQIKRDPWKTNQENAYEHDDKSFLQQTADNLNYAFNPIAKAPWETKSTQPAQSQEMQQQQLEQLQKGSNNTPLDFDKLDKQYKTQDEANYAALHKRLFDRIKNQEEQLLEEKKQLVAEQEREEEMKKRQEAEEANQNHYSDTEPQGKQKGKLGQARRKASADPMEAGKIK